MNAKRKPRPLRLTEIVDLAQQQALADGLERERKLVEALQYVEAYLESAVECEKLYGLPTRAEPLLKDVLKFLRTYKEEL